MIGCIRNVWMWLPFCLLTKPSHPYFQPLLSATTIKDRQKTKNNLLQQKMITNDAGTMREANKELSFNSLLQQGEVISCLPFLPSILSFVTRRRTLFALYILIANTTYLHRRSHLRKMTKRKLLQIRTTREEGVNIGMYITNIVAWQVFVTCIFPILEPLSRIFGYVSFYYFYPNANGCGIIFEPLSVQHLPMKKRQRSQLRLDWHEFSVNVGNIGRDGFRHPPCVVRNLPHLDIPRLQMKHWPWRRKHRLENDF
ncbi:hypothetical protein ACHAXM_009361 [Skeletonema potamos]